MWCSDREVVDSFVNVFRGECMCWQYEVIIDVDNCDRNVVDVGRCSSEVVL